MISFVFSSWIIYEFHNISLNVSTCNKIKDTKPSISNDENESIAKAKYFPKGGGGGNRGIQIHWSAQIWSKIRDPTMILSKFESAKALLSGSHNPGSDLNCKLNPQSEPKY